MQKIQEYSLWVIDKVFRFYGERANKFETTTLHRQKQKIEFTKGIDETEQERYEQILKYLESDALTITFHLSIAQYLYPEFYHMLKDLTGQGATLALALRLTGGEHSHTHSRLKTGYSRLRQYLCTDKKSWNFLYTELYAGERLVLYLSGSNEPDEDIKECCHIYIPSHKENQNEIGKYAKQIENIFLNINKMKKDCILQLCGEKGRGRKSILKKLADKEGEGWIFVNYARLRRMAGKDLDYYVWLVKRESFLYNFGICYDYEKPEKPEDTDTFIAKCLETDRTLIKKICICTDSRTELISHTKIPIIRLDIPPCGRKERINIWKEFAKEWEINLDYEKYGSKFKLNPGDIKKVFECIDAVCHKGMSEEEIDKIVADFCVSATAAPEKGSIKRVSSLYTMEDLKLEKRQKDILQNVCAHIKFSHKVYDIWNMEDKYAYGKNVTALFYGPPGTGKTMAANVLSNELKMPLYIIDLSQVVDKYIGETEKRLEEIFTYAQNSNVILFFDEADAIFGKRTEVKESKDRYANTEISYILQRIEQYDGIIILATNLKNNIDEAFMRRMKYVVEFEMPDKKTRKEIWESGFSKEVPLEDIDFDYLAEKVELSGGYIKNIILNAVFLGAKDGGKVSMKHIILSVCNEYTKLGKVLGTQDFEKYAYYFLK